MFDPFLSLAREELEKNLCEACQHFKNWEEEENEEMKYFFIRKFQLFSCRLEQISNHEINMTILLSTFFEVLCILCVRTQRDFRYVCDSNLIT